MRHRILIAGALATLAVFLSPPIPQDPDYHVMADQRTCLGIANCFNVLSNIPFAIVGILGLAATFGRRRLQAFSIDPWECWPYAILFVGVTATAVGSSYYHLAPDNARLVWDRLPMTLGFMGLLTALMAERVNRRVARWLLVPLIVLGATSVLHWYWGEQRGAGDLRLYAIVQFGSLIVVALLLALYKSRYTDSTYLVAGLIIYAAAKLLELADRQIFERGEIVSGHTSSILPLLPRWPASRGCCESEESRTLRTQDHGPRTNPGPSDGPRTKNQGPGTTDSPAIPPALCR